MCTLNSKCNTKVANGLAAKECQFDSPSHNLAWCSFPDEPNSEQVHLFSAPHKNLQDSSQRYFIDQDPRTTHLAGNLAWSEQWCFFLKNPKCIWKKNQSTSRYVTLYKNPKYHPRCFTNKSKMKIRSKNPKYITNIHFGRYLGKSQIFFTVVFLQISSSMDCRVQLRQFRHLLAHLETALIQ